MIYFNFEIALLLEVTRLNHDKRQLEDQLRQMQDKYEGRVHELEGAGEETERHYVALLESRKRELDDLRLHLESVEKKLEANKQFVEVRLPQLSFWTENNSFAQEI